MLICIVCDNHKRINKQQDAQKLANATNDEKKNNFVQLSWFSIRLFILNISHIKRIKRKSVKSYC